MKNKKGVSGIIATVLLILITITAVFLIASFVIPFIRDNLENRNELTCFELGDKAKLVRDKSCYQDTFSPAYTNVWVKMWEADIEKFYLELENSDGNVDYKVEDWSWNHDGEEREFPYNGEIYTRVSIGAIIGEQRCSISDTINLERCPTP